MKIWKKKRQEEVELLLERNAIAVLDASVLERNATLLLLY